jgi:hypothetical protein
MKLPGAGPVWREGTSLPLDHFPVMTARFGLLFGGLLLCFFSAILPLERGYRSRLASGNQAGGGNFP